MSKYIYSDVEQEINNVLVYQNKELKGISFPDVDLVDGRIVESENILRSLGYKLPEKNDRSFIQKKVMVVPTWESLCIEAESVIGNNASVESIFSSEELRKNSESIKAIRNDFNELYKLDKTDFTIIAAAGLLSAAVEILFVGIPHKTPSGLSAGKLSDYIRSEFDKKFPAEEMERLANSQISKVPYDAQDNRNTKVFVEGLSAYYHRLLSLGHDPLLGFLFGVLDIMAGNMTTIDKNGRIVTQFMEVYSDRKETELFSAIIKQIIHLKTDISTSMGLPVPLMGVFNLFQFGNIGKENQTIAEIVQGMYYEGYDFIHFCSMTIPMMIVEVMVRVCYSLKRIKEGYSIKDSIPFSLDRVKHPKLSTMLFLAHSGATAINAGKVYFTKNPLEINYPQWLAFGKYSYSQLKWVLREKPELRNNYVDMKLNESFFETIISCNKLFDDFSKEYIVVFE